MLDLEENYIIFFIFLIFFLDTIIKFFFLLHGNGDTLRLGREIQCLPYAGFFSLLFLSDKVVKLVAGGSVIKGATPSSFNRNSDHFSLTITRSKDIRPIEVFL